VRRPDRADRPAGTNLFSAHYLERDREFLGANSEVVHLARKRATRE
jgi:hypothetical protein